MCSQLAELAARQRRDDTSHERLLPVRIENPATDTLFHRDLLQRVPPAATRISSREQRTTLLLDEAQGAFHRGVLASP
jgi:hypothetical protein